MDPKHTGQMLRHLEKQNELLMNAYRSMSHELHKLQVEEEMLMRSFYDLMAAHGLTAKSIGLAPVNVVNLALGDSQCLSICESARTSRLLDNRYGRHSHQLMCMCCQSITHQPVEALQAKLEDQVSVF